MIRITENAADVLREVTNEVMSRTQLLMQTLDPRRDINFECGYLDNPEPEDYKQMWRRELGKRVVNSYPDGCWRVYPEIRESQDPNTDTAFDADMEALEDSFHLRHWMHRIDVLSGIGNYGVLLLGINDGKPLIEPVEGIDENGEKVGNPAHELIYLRAFDQTLAEVISLEGRTDNKRYGQPSMYNLKLTDPKVNSAANVSMRDLTDQRCHWSRIIHVADNRTTSEVFGDPRQECVWNRLMDIRKIAGGSGEMFWKGGFPGYSFEVNPEVDGGVAIDEDKMREAFDAYQNGLQRYLALVGLNAKTLGSQIADPEPHIMVQLKLISANTGIPLRILMGSEAAHLASTQDDSNWEDRLSHRQQYYVTPMLVSPVVDRLVALGIVSEPQESYAVTWPDLSQPTKREVAEWAQIVVEALVKYIESELPLYIPPLQMLGIMGFEPDVAEEILVQAEAIVSGDTGTDGSDADDEFA